MESIVVRQVERFPEPEFSRLQREVFSQVQLESEELAAALRQEADRAEQVKHTHSPMYRVGAYVADELVGWSCGWTERGDVFYMANSGVVASWRRRGVYTALLSAVRAYATSVGAVAIRSQHSVLNNPVLVAKLQAGFHISGLSQSARMGTLVELTFHFHSQRHELFRKRALPYVPPVA